MRKIIFGLFLLYSSGVFAATASGSEYQGKCTYTNSKGNVEYNGICAISHSMMAKENSPMWYDITFGKKQISITIYSDDTATVGLDDTPAVVKQIAGQNIVTTNQNETFIFDEQ